jgi:Eukaryotic aspartyl protease
MWVLGAGCSGISGDRDLWDPKSSKSAQYKEKSFRIYYGGGTIVEGDLFTDNVTIGGFTVCFTSLMSLTIE